MKLKIENQLLVKILALLTLTSLGAVSCTAPGNMGCVAGTSIACACPDGRMGAQVCGDAGSFAVCICSPMSDSGVSPSSDAALDASSDGVSVDGPSLDGVETDSSTVDVQSLDQVAAAADVVGVDVDPSVVAPKAIAPLSLGNVTQLRPTLRWNNTGDSDGAVIQLCRDRACTNVIETLRAIGTSVQPSANLLARSVVFWRMRGTRRGVDGTQYSPTWLFHVPALSAVGGVDTSYLPHTDLNGDGFDDLVIGAESVFAAGAEYAGRVQVFLGSARGIGADPSSQIDGLAAMEFFGHAVAGAGDVDGDGFGDVIISAWAASEPGRQISGAARVYHGNAAGVLGPLAWTIRGDAALDSLGQSVAGAGDVNRDGFADVIVGVPGSRGGGALNTGSARVYLGSASGLRMNVAFEVFGMTESAALGISVASAGDVNGDGASDIIVGALGGTMGALARTGLATVFYGGAGAAVMRAGPTIAGTFMDERFGGCVASAGDTDNNGYTEVLVGSIFSNPSGRHHAGSASLFSGGAMGLAPAATLTLNGVTTEDLFGTTVAGIGDINGDGFGDFAVGAEQGMVAGLGRGTATVYLGSNRLPAITLNGVNNGDRFGVGLAGGDINGDGYADLAVGAPGPQVGMASASARSVTVYAGRMVGFDVNTTILRGGSSFGVSVASFSPSRWITNFAAVTAPPLRRTNYFYL